MADDQTDTSPEMGEADDAAPEMGEAKTDSTSDSSLPASVQAEMAAMRKALKRANKEAEQFRLAEQERKDAELSEADRLRKKQEEAERRASAAEDALRQERIRRAVEVAALSMGFNDAEDATLLADLSAVEIGEDGSVRNVKPALEKLLKAKPWLAGQPEKQLPAGTPNRGTARTPAAVPPPAKVGDPMVQELLATRRYNPF